MIWAGAIVAVAGLAVLAWHMQRPKPRSVAISFARFVPQLPVAPSRTRFALAWPRDKLPLACLVAAVVLAIWALLDGRREYQAARPDHLGVRVVLDLSHSMGVDDGGASRLARALSRLEMARREITTAGASSACLELVAVGSRPGPVQPLSLGDALPLQLAEGVRAEGAEAASLAVAAALPQSDCALTHVLVLTDMPASMIGAGEAVDVVWDQIGASVGNAGIRQLTLAQSAFGATASEIRIEGVVSGRDMPRQLSLSGPSGQQDVPVYPTPEVDGRWFATAAYAGPGDYHAWLPGKDGYAGDDRILARLDRPASVAAEWQLAALPLPAGLIEGHGEDLLVTSRDQLTGDDLARPLLLTYSGFGASGQERRIGTFTEDPALLSVLNFDAFEAALPSAWPGPLPPGFAPVMVDDTGGVLIARREQPRGVIVPTPVTDPGDPARNLSLTLFFLALVDIVATPPQQQSLEWRDAEGNTIPDAWRESMTGRPAGQPADLRRLSQASRAHVGESLWPWLVLGALLALLAERLLRLFRTSEAVL